MLAHSSGDGEWAFLCAFCRPRKNRSVVGSFRPWGVELRCGTDLGQRLPQGGYGKSSPNFDPNVKGVGQECSTHMGIAVPQEHRIRLPSL